MTLIVTSLNAATATGAGTAIFFDVPKTAASMQVITTGSPSSFEVDLEGTIDGTTFFLIASADPGHLIVWRGGGSGGTGNPPQGQTMPAIIGIRANLVSITGGSSPTFTAVIAVAG